MTRIIRIVFSPRDEWRRIAAEPWPRALAYGAGLSLVPALAALAMVRTSEVPLADNAALVTYFASFLGVLAIAAAFWLLGRMFGARAGWGAAVQVAMYGTTPLWISAALLFSSVLVMVCVVSLVYVLYLYYLGAQLVFGIREEDAAIFVMLAVVAATAASTLAGAGVAMLGLL